MFFVINKSKDDIALVGMVIVISWCLFMIFPYIAIERALKKKFDKDGNRSIIKENIASIKLHLRSTYIGIKKAYHQ